MLWWNFLLSLFQCSHGSTAGSNHTLVASFCMFEDWGGVRGVIGVLGGGWWASQKCAIAMYWSLLKRRKCIWTGERVHPFLFPLRFLIWHLIPFSAFPSGDKLEQATPDWIKSSLIKLYRGWHGTLKNTLLHEYCGRRWVWLYDWGLWLVFL